MDFITDYIEKNKVMTILEIGTAVGYSAIMMASSNPLVRVVSIEKDKNRYIEAVKNIKKVNSNKNLYMH